MLKGSPRKNLVWTASRTQVARRDYWLRFLGSLCIVLVLVLASIHTPFYTSDPNLSATEVEALDTVIFEDAPIPIVSQQSVVPNAPAKPRLLFQIDDVDPEEMMEIDLQGLDVTPAEFQGRIVRRPDTPVRVLTIVEPTFDSIALPKAWRGETVQVRILIGRNGDVRYAEILPESLPNVEGKTSMINTLQDKIDAALTEWAFRPANHDGQDVLSYTVQTFRL
ncbi:MAG: hypothetical protein RI513_05620 [Balneolaceae bacterium]|nr:hypothetical protein [Balneolaceae bacterium]